MTVLTMPASPELSLVNYDLLDFGFVQRPSTGSAGTRIDRPGMRYKGDFAFPAMPAATALPFESRLERGMSEGLRVKWPLLGVSQGSPGSPRVSGSSSAGTTLVIAGLTPGYGILEGYWLNWVDSSGVYHLHRAAEDRTASVAGVATLSIWPPLRGTPVSNDTIVLDEPMIEGLVTSITPIARDLTKTVSLQFSLSEES